MSQSWLGQDVTGEVNVEQQIHHQSNSKLYDDDEDDMYNHQPTSSSITRESSLMKAPKLPNNKRPANPVGVCCGLCEAEKRHYHLRVAGPSMAGKTTLIRYLLIGQEESPNVTPTDVMEVSEVTWNSTSFIIWDFRKFAEDDLKAGIRATPIPSIGLEQPLIAQKQIFDALVYVVDASDMGRLRIAARDFKRLLKTYHNVPVVLVLGSKRDRPTLVDAAAVRSQLKVLETAYDRECEVFLISGLTGEGIDAAFEWLSSRIRQKEGFLASLVEFFNFKGSRDTNTISCGRFGNWDPLSMCRYSRLN